MRDELIIAFRGTSDIATALYDAEFRPKKLKLGEEIVWVHSGMWAVTKKLWKKLLPFLNVIYIFEIIYFLFVF